MNSAAAFLIGAGPGIGRSVARRFAEEGFDIGLVARSSRSLDAVARDVSESGTRPVGVTADAADEAGLRDALDHLERELGTPEIVVYNAAVIQWDALGDLTLREHLDAWAVNVGGAITAAAHLGPRMAARGGGTILLTGGMPTPIPGVTSLSLGKAGLRALTELLAAQFGPAGVHVATVTVAGAVAPGTAFDPDEIAEQYWTLHTQPREAWVHELLYAGRQPAPVGEGG
jgi:NAD(P)-dependent dehydrogenase (short-subunit alcohol dehydrogenase family)